MEKVPGAALRTDKYSVCAGRSDTEVTGPLPASEVLTAQGHMGRWVMKSQRGLACITRHEGPGPQLSPTASLCEREGGPLARAQAAMRVIHGPWLGALVYSPTYT